MIEDIITYDKHYHKKLLKVNRTTKCSKNIKINKMSDLKKELTYGQKAVGLTFNHGEGEIHELINKSKQMCADCIDLMDEVRNRSGHGEGKIAFPLGVSGERAALATIAIRKLQDAQMQMVKAITWKD